MKASLPDDPLRRLGTKALRRLARQYKIKHFYRKSPASLRRAIRRAQQRTQPAAEPAATTQPQTAAPLSTEEQTDLRRKAELKAYEEHRLRYLFMPSRFVHKGTHEEFLLEKDDELDLPDFYQEDELVALSIDPYRFYVYWDFAEETLYDVRSWLAEDNPFLLRIYDVSDLVFNGSNAHNSWESPCHPLVREWYLNAPVNGRDLIVELGVRQATGFRTLLRSNKVSIPPATVSSVTGDIFAHFVPGPALVNEAPQPVVPGQDQVPQPKPETSAHLFFQEYVPSPVRFNPPPPPKTILSREAPMQPVAQPPARPSFPQAIHPLPTPGWDPQPLPVQKPQSMRQPAFEAVPQVQTTPDWEAEQPAEPMAEPISGQAEWTEKDVLSYLEAGGSKTLTEWLGLPHEIRWLSDLPMGMSPVFFEHWIEDPYDRAVMISYAIWPWEMTEYVPLGASDWTLRKFLGASLFSWFGPAGSERVRWWQKPPGASEQMRWIRPFGASELSWSGGLQTADRPEKSAWHLWPAPASGRSGFESGKGLFG